MDGLNAAVHGVRVERFKDKHTNAAVLALISLPFSSSLAGGPSLADFTSDIGIIRDNLEVSIFLTWLCCSRICCARKGEKDVIGGCAREFSAVLDDGPFARRVIKESHRRCVNILKHGVCQVVHWDLVGSIRVPRKDTLAALASSLSACVEAFKGHVVNASDTSVSTIRLNFVDGAWRGIGNMQGLSAHIVAKEHQTHLIFTVTVVVGRAVLGSSLTINFRVAKLDHLTVAFTSSLQVDTKLIVDASDVMSSHFNSSVMSSNALLLRLVSFEMTEFVACAMIITIFAVRVNVCSSSLD